jgi:hypothetical protein
MDQLASLAAATIVPSNPCVEVQMDSNPLLIALAVSAVVLAIVFGVMIWRQKVVRENSGMDFSRRMYESDEDDNDGDEMNAEETEEPYEEHVARPNFDAL